MRQIIKHILHLRRGSEHILGKCREHRRRKNSVVCSHGVGAFYGAEDYGFLLPGTAKRREDDGHLPDLAVGFGFP